MPTEIIVIIVIGVVLFGARHLPSIGKGLGQGVREFKREVKEQTDEKAKHD